MQLEGQQGKTKGGSGLGLAISKAIVDQHGGRVGVESQADKGCRFWFEVPLQISMLPSENLNPAGTGRRILIIDDDEEVVDLLNGLLSYGSYELTRTSSITEAGRFLSERCPDVLLLALRLPDGNGFDLLSKLVVAQSASTPPFVVLPERDPKLHTLGNPVLIDWLIAPFDEEYLRRSIELSLSRQTIEQAKFVLFTGSQDTHELLAAKLTGLKMKSLNQHEDAVSAQRIHSLEPDIIILDIQAAQQICLDVLQVLRQENVRPIPLVVYSDKSLDSEEIDKLTLAFSRHISSLYMTEPEFLGTLRRLLDSRLRLLEAQPQAAVLQ